METPLSKLSFLFLGTYIGICAIIFNAQRMHCLPEYRQLQSSPRPPPPDSTPQPIESRSSPDSPPPPPQHRPRSPPQPHKNSTGTKPSKHSSSGRRNAPHKRKLRPPQSASRKMNSGKIVGLTFLAFAGVLQIAVILFMAVKRRQLF